MSDSCMDSKVFETFIKIFICDEQILCTSHNPDSGAKWGFPPHQLSCLPSSHPLLLLDVFIAYFFFYNGTISVGFTVIGLALLGKEFNK